MCAGDDGLVACDSAWLLYSYSSLRLIRGDPGTPSVELGTLRRAQHAGHATLDFPTPWIAHINAKTEVHTVFHQ
jgi:hypothetical protein